MTTLALPPTRRATTRRSIRAMQRRVRRALSNAALAPRAILVTHHHDDHQGGVAALAGETGATVYAPEDGRIALPT